MRVLGIYASPRKLGNSEIGVKEIFKNLPNDWSKELLNLSNLNLQPCRACYACLKQGRSCILQDDLALLLQKIKAADRIILIAPVYFLGEQTALKLLKDRLIGLLNEGNDFFRGQPCVIVTTHAIKDWEGYAREEMLALAYFLGFKVLGNLVCQKTLPGDIVDEEGKHNLRALAKALVTGMPLAPSKDAPLSCPHCQSSLLQIKPDSTWRCPLCNSTGKLSYAEDKLLLLTDKLTVHRFSPEGLAHHGQVLLDVNKEFLARRRQVLSVLKEYK